MHCETFIENELKFIVLGNYDFCKKVTLYE